MLSLNVGAWIAQGMLAAMFGMAGMMKSTRPMDGLAERMEWVKQYKPSTVRLIGLVEVAGALGMVLPMVTGILPWLTPLARWQPQPGRRRPTTRGQPPKG